MGTVVVQMFGNPDLDPEYSTTMTVSFEIDPSSRSNISVSGYFSDIENMIIPEYKGPWKLDPSVDVWERTNIKSADVFGTEAT